MLRIGPVDFDFLLFSILNNFEILICKRFFVEKFEHFNFFSIQIAKKYKKLSYVQPPK